MDIYEKLDLPYRPIKLGNSQVIMQGKINLEYLYGMFAQGEVFKIKGVDGFGVCLGNSVWAPQEIKQERQFYFTQKIFNDKPLQVVEPTHVEIIKGFTLEDFSEYPNSDERLSYLMKCARMVGENILKNTALAGKTGYQTEVEYNGFVKLNKPERFGFGINNEVDKKIGCLSYLVEMKKI